MRQLGFLVLVFLVVFALLAAPAVAVGASERALSEESERAEPSQEISPCQRSRGMTYARVDGVGSPLQPCPYPPPIRRALPLPPPVGPILPLRC